MTDISGDEMILARWGGEESINRFLQARVADLCPLICGTDVASPVLQIKPTWLSRGLLGERCSGADYEPKEGDFPATIGIFPGILQDLEKLDRVLAHELIHHWEHLGATGSETLSYPPGADDIVTARYVDPFANRRWRSGHSRIFISKASAVAVMLNIPLRALLFESEL